MDNSSQGTVEFPIPKSNISFTKAIANLHNLSDKGLSSFMYEFVGSLNNDQLKTLDRHVAGCISGRNFNNGNP